MTDSFPAPLDVLVHVRRRQLPPRDNRKRLAREEEQH
jgi:hypothetical protein